MTVSVLVPWRPTPDRAPGWAWLRPRWESLGFEVVEGACGEGPWVKAHAVADALGRAAGDVLVIADADVWCDDVAEAVRAVEDGAPWAMPHWEVCRLDRPATDAVLAGDAPLGRVLTYDRRPYVGRRGGGMTVLRREVYEAVPMDPRFAGWGREDDAHALALRCLAGGERRGFADLWHLWHEPQPRPSEGKGSPESEALYKRYQAAKRDRPAMQTLIDEAKAVAHVA